MRQTTGLPGDDVLTMTTVRLRWLDTPAGMGCTAGLVCFVILALTAPSIPIVWDEGEYLGRSGRVVAWFGLIGRTGFTAFSPAVIHEYWPFITFDEGHPAWGAIPLALGTALFKSVLHPLTAARLGTIAVFSAACAGVAFRMRKVYGRVGAIVAVTALITFPRLFAEAHFGTLDGQLTAWWLLLWASEASLRSDVRSGLVSGLLAGLTSATKFPGWLAWPPMIAARLLTGDRRRSLGLLTVLAAGACTFYVVNPPLWSHPVETMTTHVQLNLQRTLNVPVTFFGEKYDLYHSLPWYNTLVWALIVTPVHLLLLGALGVAHAVRRRDAVTIALVLHWAALMIVRAVPNTPPHDGVRLFLPAFGFWCVLGGVGAQQAWDMSRRIGYQMGGIAIRASIAIGLAAGAVNVARYYPQTLSHYNLLVGGVSGAGRLGMEPTYWWDALDNDVLAWLNDHTGPGERVAFSSTANISLLRSWGRLHPEQADRRATFKWYVFQNRTSFLADSDRLMMQNEQPAYVKYPGHHTADNVPGDLNVPLLFIYSYDQYQAAVAAVRDKG